MLKFEDVKVGDELECIDREAMLCDERLPGVWREYMYCQNRFVVSEIYTNCILYFDGLDMQLTPINDATKYFKKKELRYTFDDLIDVAVQAVKDGLIACDDFKRHSISFCVAWDEDDGYELASHHDAKYFDEAVRFIQSLYKETFVIECEEDVKRIKKGAEITLSNSNKSKVSVIDCGENTLKVANWDYFLQFFSLKGATVEQSRDD